VIRKAKCHTTRKHHAKNLCKLCYKRKYAKLYYESNKENCLKIARDWKKENPKRVKELHKRHYKQNKEKYLKRTRDWEKGNPKRVKEFNKRHYEQNKEKYLEKSKQWKKVNSKRVKELSKRYYKQHKVECLAQTKRWVKANPKWVKAQARKRHLRNKYNLTLKRYKKMLNEQDYKCAMKNCKVKHYNKTKLHVDHNHKTGKVRGLLCFRCNRILGDVKDRINILRDCIEYLKERD